MDLFYSMNVRDMRTLYWSPDLKTDASGKVEVRLYMSRKDQEIILTAEGLIQ